MCVTGPLHALAARRASIHGARKHRDARFLSLLSGTNGPSGISLPSWHAAASCSAPSSSSSSPWSLCLSWPQTRRPRAKRRRRPSRHLLRRRPRRRRLRSRPRRPSPEEPSPSPAPESPSSEPSPAAAQPSPAEETDDPGDDQGQAGKPDKADKVKTPEEPITLTGTVTTATDADGDVVYSLATGGTSYELDAGPSWFFGTNHPLKPYVGESVRIDGEKKVGSNEVDVLKVNGTVIREPGKPPWAGGWKRVGQIHPGWSQEKWDRWQSKKAGKAARFGGCWPPGHCKETSGTQAAPTPNPDGSPD